MNRKNRIVSTLLLTLALGLAAGCSRDLIRVNWYGQQFTLAEGDKLDWVWYDKSISRDIVPVYLAEIDTSKVVEKHEVTVDFCREKLENKLKKLPGMMTQNAEEAKSKLYFDIVKMEPGTLGRHVMFGEVNAGSIRLRGRIIQNNKVVFIFSDYREEFGSQGALRAYDDPKLILGNFFEGMMTSLYKELKKATAAK